MVIHQLFLLGGRTLLEKLISGDSALMFPDSTDALGISVCFIRGQKIFLTFKFKLRVF